jgi:hypothetical protein
VWLQEKVIAKDPPDFYLDKLRTYLDPTAAKSSKVNVYINPQVTIWFGYAWLRLVMRGFLPKF